MKLRIVQAINYELMSKRVIGNGARHLIMNFCNLASLVRQEAV